tara:strand:- start:29 stop:586 length:558 start_codon:yes stop_codon:yes gene_type:complete
MPITLNGNGTATGLTAAPNLASSGLTTGSILQVQHVKDTSSQTWQQSGLAQWADITALTVNITPAATSSKILVLAHTCLAEQSTDYGIWFRVMRGSTALVGTSSNDRTPMGFGNSASGSYFDDKIVSADFSYVDEPSSTSQLTYKIQAVSRYSPHNWGYNRSYDNTDGGAFGQGVSTLTLLEIAG